MPCLLANPFRLLLVLFRVQAQGLHYCTVFYRSWCLARSKKMTSIDVAIVGAGAAGLTAAFELSGQFSFKVLEASSGGYRN